MDDGGQLVFQGLVLLLAAIQVHSQFHVVFRKEFPGKVIFAGVVEVKGALGKPCRPAIFLVVVAVTPFSTKRRRAMSSISSLV